MNALDLTIFNLSPIAMWLQDFSGIKKIFDDWSAHGITDIKQYLLEDLDRLHPCLAAIKTLNINKSTLTLYEAIDLNEILEKFALMHTEETALLHVEFFVALWNRQDNYSIPAVNYTCKGKKIDIQLKANFLKGYEDNWECLLLTTENITDYQNARRFAESLFFHSPTALWVRDYSTIKLIFDQLKLQGIVDLEHYIATHPDFVKYCFDNIKNVGVNQTLLDLFHAIDKKHYLSNLWHIFRENTQQNFYAQLLALWDGQHQQQRECEYQTIDGELLSIQEQLMIFPDSHHNWDTVQIAFTNFTERKKLENHLLYVSKHDQLTQLYNRTFLNEEIARIQKLNPFPVSCIFLDINGLKEINDVLGHDQGDLVLQRFGKVLKASIINTPYSASRVGGDEFVILMPKAKQQHIDSLLHSIMYELEVDQIKHPDLPIHVAIGFSTTQSNETIEELLKRADQIMYENKKDYYETSVKK